MLRLYRGARNPRDTRWATPDREAAAYYARRCGGRIWVADVDGSVGAELDYPIKVGCDLREEDEERNWDSIYAAQDAGLALIGPIYDHVDDVALEHTSYVVVDECDWAEAQSDRAYRSQSTT